MSEKFGYKVEYQWGVRIPPIPGGHGTPIDIPVLTSTEPRLSFAESPALAALEVAERVEKERPDPEAVLHIIRMTKVRLLGA